MSGALFREFAFTLAGAVFISGVVALTLSPMMASKLLKPHSDAEKDKKPPGTHFKGAPMPYFMRIVGGVGMHAGYLPGYPASHGCVRLPDAFAQKLFATTELGMTVIVSADEAAHPERLILHAVKGMIPKNRLGDRLLTKLKVYKGKDHPHAAQSPTPFDVAKLNSKNSRSA